jgi:hypothetical protein
VQAASDVQQIEVRPIRQLGAPIHDHPPVEQRQIERLSVVRNQQIGALDALRERLQKRQLFGGATQ